MRDASSDLQQARFPTWVLPFFTNQPFLLRSNFTQILTPLQQNNVFLTLEGMYDHMTLYVFRAVVVIRLKAKTSIHKTDWDIFLDQGTVLTSALLRLGGYFCN